MRPDTVQNLGGLNLSTHPSAEHTPHVSSEWAELYVKHQVLQSSASSSRVQNHKLKQPDSPEPEIYFLRATKAP